MKNLIFLIFFGFLASFIEAQEIEAQEDFLYKDTLYQRHFLLEKNIKCHYLCFKNLEIYNFYIKNPENEKKEVLWCYVEETNFAYKFSKNLTKHEDWNFPNDSLDMKEFSYTKFPYCDFKSIDCNRYDFEIILKFKEIAKNKLPKRF